MHTPANPVCPHKHWVLRVHTTPHQSSHGPKACQASDPGTNSFFPPNNWDIMALSYKPYETVRHFMTFLVTSANNQLGLMFALRPGQAICRHWLSSTRHVGRSLGPFQKINTTQIWHSEQEHHPVSSVLQPCTIIHWTNPYPIPNIVQVLNAPLLPATRWIFFPASHSWSLKSLLPDQTHQSPWEPAIVGERWTKSFHKTTSSCQILSPTRIFSSEHAGILFGSFGKFHMFAAALGLWDIKVPKCVGQ